MTPLMWSKESQIWCINGEITRGIFWEQLEVGNRSSGFREWNDSFIESMFNKCWLVPKKYYRNIDQLANNILNLWQNEMLRRAWFFFALGLERCISWIGKPSMFVGIDFRLGLVSGRSPAGHQHNHSLRNHNTARDCSSSSCPASRATSTIASSSFFRMDAQ